jgi:Cdc6-like AAA superfamily ATPase
MAKDDFEDRQDDPAEFRRLLEECRDLYQDCARDYARRRPELVRDADAFVDKMLDLHRGLVLKVFVEMAWADGRVGPAELELGRQVFEHAWGKRLDDEQLKEALAEYTENTHLRWESLVRPFAQFSSFRPHAARLQELVLALAKHVRRAGGREDARCRRQLKWVRAELRRTLDPAALAGEPEPLPAGAAGESAQAQQTDFELDARTARMARAVCVRPGAGRDQLDDVLEELEGLVGLASIKQDVRELVNFLKIQAERARMDLPATPVSLHAVFTGNPGTGKTTVARLVGRVLGALGVLAKGHLVETDRSGLVAEYAGQTGPKTHQRVDQALDGVLFIDEAYSLVAEHGDDPYGAEALQTLLKRMEDDRDRLVVVLAGYPQPMEALLHRNPGLSSRFPRTFSFPDYTAAELGRIYEAMCERDRYQLPARTRARLLVGLGYLLQRRDEHFGNGRLARNVFERAVRRLANRLSDGRPLTRELLTTLEPPDLMLEGVPESAYEALGRGAVQFTVACPGCGNASAVPAAYLGRAVSCRRCAHEFTASWGEPG